jgi:hypothetical protein
MNEHPMSCEHLKAGAEAEAAYLMVVLEYYDGPTGGVMQCQICFAEYRFTMLDWDDHQGERVYSLAPLPPRSFEQVVAILSAHEPPKWPLWFPLRQYSSQQIYDLVERQLAEIVGKAGLAIKVFAMPQWGERILAVKALSSGDIQDVQSWFALEAPTAGRDWFSFLGLVREAAT